MHHVNMISWTLLPAPHILNSPCSWIRVAECSSGKLYFKKQINNQLFTAGLVCYFPTTHTQSKCITPRDILAASIPQASVIQIRHSIYLLGGASDLEVTRVLWMYVRCPSKGVMRYFSPSLLKHISLTTMISPLVEIRVDDHSLRPVPHIRGCLHCCGNYTRSNLFVF